MANLGSVFLKLGLINKEFESDLKRAGDSLKEGLGKMKTMIIGAALGSYLMTGANEAINNAVDQMHAKLNLLNQGLTELQYEQIAFMAEKFELLGSNAEVAQLKITEFVTQGKAVGLKELGIYLDQDTLAMVKNMDAAQRLQFVMSEFPKYLGKMDSMLPNNVKNMIQMRKTMDDLKEAMGSTFLKVIQSLTDAFGGIIPTMKMAIIGFTAYKTAMILGNVGIGISKAIAMSSVWSTPAAIAMGASALASIGALIGGAGLAIGALNSIETQNNTPPPETTTTDQKENTIVVVRDKFGETTQMISNSSGGGSSSIQTNYGSK